MSIVFMGTAEFAVPALRACANHVSLVVSQPDRPSGRHLQLKPSPVKNAALELCLRVETPEKARDPEFIELVRSLNPEILLVAAYGQILSENLLNSAKYGGINLHGSILPRYRGAAPIQRAIEAGDVETGVTLMQMAKGMDTGDIIDIKTIPIFPDATYGDLAIQLADVAATLTQSWLPKLMAGEYPRKEQDHEQATHAAKISKEEAALDFKSAASQEYNKFRAFTPAPGAYLRLPFGLVKVSQAKFSPLSGRPGEILGTSEGCLIAFQDGSLQLLEVQPEGKKRMSGVEFANGFRLKPGMNLLEPIQ